MAYRSPPFALRFPLLLAGSVLLAQPMSSLAQQVDCRASSDGQGWVCSPHSASPSLPPRPARQVVAPRVVEPEAAAPETAPARQTVATDNPYSHLDWVPREQLSEELQARIAPYCSGTYVEPPRSGRDDDTALSQLPIYAEADRSEFQQTDETGTLSGDVLLRQGRIQARAGQASIDRNNDLIRLSDRVRLRDQGVLLMGEQAELRIDTGATSIEDVDYVIHDAHTRGSADRVERREDAIIVLSNSSYTTCEPGNNAWALHSRSVELDRQEGWGDARHVTLRVKDVPVFYTPYLSFPLDDRRKTGVLPPSYSSSSDTGTEITIPYYLNLAPNYDATLYPRLMSKRGLLMEAEGRHLGDNSATELNAAYLDDRDFNENRWRYRARHQHQLGSNWRANLDTAGISDPFYFQDLSSALESRPASHLDQRADLSYYGSGWRFQALVHGYERATITAITPYERLPQLHIDGGHWLADSGVRVDYDAEYSYFDRDLRSGLISGKNGLQTDSVGNFIPKPDENLSGLQRATGHRVALSPEISYPLRNSWAYITPALKVNSVFYDLDFDRRTGDGFDYSDTDRSPSSHVPVASLDTGLYFDRDTNLFGRSFRQSLEPRAYYLYAPYRNQDDQPLFDTYENTFSYAALFRDDRFSGRDRTGDTQQLTLGVTSRLFDNAGREKARASLGNILYFNDRRVQLLDPDGEPRERNSRSSSAYAAELAYQIEENWRLRTSTLWDPDDSSANAGSFFVNYQPEHNKLVNAGYSFRNSINTYDALTGNFQRQTNRRIDQSDLSFMWPLNPQWSLIGRWQYDFADDRTLEAFGGLEYDSCCWKLRLINRYWVDYNEFESVTRDETKRGIFLQIVLKGLGNVTGNRVESLLTDGIPGYRERDNNAF